MLFKQYIRGFLQSKQSGRLRFPQCPSYPMVTMQSLMLNKSLHCFISFFAAERRKLKLKVDRPVLGGDSLDILLLHFLHFGCVNGFYWCLTENTALSGGKSFSSVYSSLMRRKRSLYVIRAYYGNIILDGCSLACFLLSTYCSHQLLFSIHNLTFHLQDESSNFLYPSQIACFPVPSWLLVDIASCLLQSICSTCKAKENYLKLSAHWQTTYPHCAKCVLTHLGVTPSR